MRPPNRPAFRRAMSSSTLVAGGADDEVASQCADSVTDESSLLLQNFLKRRKNKDSDSIDAVRHNLEVGNFVEIFQYMSGKLDAQALCVQFIKDGKFESNKKRKIDDEEPKAAPSTNKFIMLSIDNWCEILQYVDSDKFPKPVMSLGSKSWLCTVGCWMGGIQKDSAIPARSLRVIGMFIRQRSTDIYGSRHLSINAIPDASGEKLEVQHDFATNVGSFTAEYHHDDHLGQSGRLVHYGTERLSCPIPDEFKGQILVFKKNHSDDEATLAGKYSDPLLRRIFKESGIDIPKTWWQKRITDGKEIVALGPASGGGVAVLRTATLAAHDADSGGSASDAAASHNSAPLSEEPVLEAPEPPPE